MAPPFTSPLILSILSDYRYEAIVPEDQYEVMSGDRCFSIRVQDHTDLFFRPVNDNGDLGLIFILQNFYRCDMLAWIDYDLDDPLLHQNDQTVSLCPHTLEVEENIYAPENDYHIIVMTAFEVSDDYGEQNIVPEGHTVELNYCDSTYGFNDGQKVILTQFPDV